MDNIPSPLLIITLVGWIGIGVCVGSTANNRFTNCPTDSAIDNCNHNNLPDINMAGRVIFQIKQLPFIDVLKLSINEVEDMCRLTRSYENLLSCISELKRNCWIDNEIKELFLQRPQIHRILDYICQNYTRWKFDCVYQLTTQQVECESEYVHSRTVATQDSFTTTQRLTVNDRPFQYIYQQCLLIYAKEHCYPRTMERCGYRTLDYAKYYLEVSRPPACTASQMTYPIIALVAFTWLSRLLSDL